MYYSSISNSKNNACHAAKSNHLSTEKTRRRMKVISFQPPDNVPLVFPAATICFPLSSGLCGRQHNPGRHVNPQKPLIPFDLNANLNWGETFGSGRPATARRVSRRISKTVRRRHESLESETFKKREGGRRGREREYYHIRSCGIVELLNTVQIGLRITLVSKTERERPQLIH